MDTQDCLRYDAVSDRYQHLEAGKPGTYHGATEVHASFLRAQSRYRREEKRAAKASKLYIRGVLQK